MDTIYIKKLTNHLDLVAQDARLIDLLISFADTNIQQVVLGPEEDQGAYLLLYEASIAIRRMKQRLEETADILKDMKSQEF